MIVRLVTIGLGAGTALGWLTASIPGVSLAGDEITLRARAHGQPIESDEEFPATPTADQWAIVVHVTLADIGVYMDWDNVVVQVIDSTSSQVARETARRHPEAGTMFTIGPYPIPTDAPPEGEQLHRVSVRISAPGYASFTYLNIPLAPGVAHGLTPILSLVEQVNDISVRKPERAPGGLPGTGTGASDRSGAFVMVGMLAGTGVLLWCTGLALGRKKRGRSPLTG